MRTSCLLILSALMLVALSSGCKSGGGSAGKATYAYVDPEFAPPESMRVPLVAFVNTSTTAEAPQYFFTHLEDALSTKPQYTLVSIWAVERDVRRKKLKDEHAALTDQWRDGRTFAPTALREFGAALGVEFVMGGEVSEWTSEEVDVNTEGYSHSDVAASFKMFDVATGKLVWEANDKFEMRSPNYDPSQGSGRKDDLGIVRGESRVVPQAPPIDEAARRVAANLVAALP